MAKTFKLLFFFSWRNLKIENKKHIYSLLAYISCTPQMWYGMSFCHSIIYVWLNLWGRRHPQMGNNPRDKWACLFLLLICSKTNTNELVTTHKKYDKWGMSYISHRPNPELSRSTPLEGELIISELILLYFLFICFI